MTSAELYKEVDTHMADSTEHNKRIASLMAEMQSLETKAGQIFCGTHTHTPPWDSLLE